MAALKIDPESPQAPTRDYPSTESIPKSLKTAKTNHVHPTKPSKDGNARIFFVGTATTILEWEGIRLMTDPNFLHAGDHVHLGPGVTGTRQTNPAIDLHELPHIDVVLLSHYHADHFDEHVESSLRRDLPIISTPHAKQHLANKDPADESFTNVHALDFWDSMSINVKQSLSSTSSTSPQMRVTGMPGKHVPDTGIIAAANDFLKAVPPTNGWMLELGYTSISSSSTGQLLSSATTTSQSTSTTQAPGPDSGTDNFECGYRIYISGDTLLVNDLKKIPELYTHAGKPIDLMLIHLGGTTIPSPKLPLLMVTMDAKQGVELVKLVNPDLTMPIHYDDYDVFLSPLSDFKTEMTNAGLGDKAIYLDRGDDFTFEVRK